MDNKSESVADLKSAKRIKSSKKSKKKESLKI